MRLHTAVTLAASQQSPPPGTLVNLTFLQHAENVTAGGPYSFATQNLGAESPDRVIVVGFGAEGSTGTMFSNGWCTIGGVAATNIAFRAHNGGGSNSAVVAGIWALNVPTGTSATIAVEVNNVSGLRSAMGLWSLTGTGGSTTPFDTAIADDDGHADGDFIIPANGSGLGVVTLNDPYDNTAVWKSPYTKHYDTRTSEAQSTFSAGSTVTPVETQVQQTNAQVAIGWTGVLASVWASWGGG